MLATARHQELGLIIATLVYPILVTLSVEYPILLLIAPLTSGFALGVASVVGPKSYCPVKLGVIPGVLGLFTSLYWARGMEHYGLLAGYLDIGETTGLLVEVLYHLTTIPAFGGVLVLAYWRLGSNTKYRVS